ncbi:MAG: metallopeptidase family protein [Pseudomonadota bacterium]
MLPLEDMEALLEEISAEFPAQLFEGLNGGIILLPETKLNAYSRNNDLFILGEYHSGGNLGRYIAIYYGSFMCVYGHLGAMQLRDQLVHTLKHEFTHHLESLAGEKGLEIKDAMFLADYLKHSGRPD